MKIAILGATGRTGRLLTAQALDAGHEVVAYVRRPGALEARPRLTVVGGQLDDRAALTEALRGCDVLVSTLGPPTLLGATLLQRALPVATIAMRDAGVDRIVVLSALGVGDTARKTPLPARIAYALLARIGSAYTDHDIAESALPGSGLRWTTAHPVMLGDGPVTGTAALTDIATVDKIDVMHRIARADVADAILQAINDPGTVDKKMLVTSRT